MDLNSFPPNAVVSGLKYLVAGKSPLHSVTEYQPSNTPTSCLRPRQLKPVHATEQCWIPRSLFPKFAWRHLRQALELPIEVAQIVEARIQGDLHNGLAGV